jgi:hypothetical protein
MEVTNKRRASSYKYDKLTIYFFEALNKLICLSFVTKSGICIIIGSLTRTYSFAFLVGL